MMATLAFNELIAANQQIKKAMDLGSSPLREVQIRSFFWSVVSYIWTEYRDLPEKKLRI